MRPEDYTPLEGRLRGPLYSSRLYIGKNHLLKSTIRGIHENYRRFAWEDIQAFTMRKTDWGWAINAVCGFVLFFLIVSFMNWHSNLPRSLVLHGMFFTPFLFALLWNIRRGPTCHVRIQTAVSDEWLGSLHRARLARRVLGQLAPIIKASQTPSDAGSAEAWMGLPVQAAMDPGLPFQPSPKSPDRGRWHQAALLFMGVGLIGNLVEILLEQPSDARDGIFLALFLLSMVISVGVLVSQSRRTSSRPLRIFGWANFGYHILMLALLFAVMFFVAIEAARHPELAESLDLREYWFYIPILYGDTALEAVLIAFGAAAVLHNRSAPPAPITPPADH